jgi:hypothetical protein
MDAESPMQIDQADLAGINRFGRTIADARGLVANCNCTVGRYAADCGDLAAHKIEALPGLSAQTRQRNPVVISIHYHLELSLAKIVLCSRRFADYRPDARSGHMESRIAPVNESDKVKILLVDDQEAKLLSYEVILA